MYKRTMLAFLAATFLVGSVSAQNARGNTTNDTTKMTLPGRTNILRLSPVTVLDLGIGLGISYEKLLGRDRMIGIVFPVSLILENTSQYNGSAYENRYYTYVYFTPGIKVYPFGQRRVTYSVGSNLMIGYGGGKGSQANWDTNGNMIIVSHTKEVFRMGVLVNNYVSFQITPSFNLGLSAGLGVGYIDRTRFTYADPVNSEPNYQYNGFNLTGQFSLTFGYQF